MTNRTYNLNNPANPAKTTKLIRILNERNIKLKEGALIVDDEFARFDVCPLHDAFALCLENREDAYIEALKSNFDEEHFLSDLSTTPSNYLYPIEATRMGAFEAAFQSAVENEFEKQNMTNASFVGNNLNFEFDDKEIRFKRIQREDVTHVSENLIERARKALKGLHMGMNSTAITKRLSAIEGFEDQIIEMGYNSGKGTTDHQKPLDLNLNNFVSLFRDIINRFAVSSISLSEARAIFCKVYQIESWHKIKHTEDKIFLPVVITETVYSEDSDSYTNTQHTVANSIPAAMIILGKKMKSHGGKFSIRHPMGGFECNCGNVQLSVYTTRLPLRDYTEDEIAGELQSMTDQGIIRGEYTKDFLIEFIADSGRKVTK